MSFYDDASWLLIPSGIKEDVVYAQKPTSGLGDLTMTRASDATYTDSTGVVRRSPYNLASWSEMFSDASWSKTGITVTPNVALAPNGTMTADRIQFSSSNRALTQTTSLGTGVVCTSSFYVLGTAGETLLFAAGGLDQLVTLTGSWQRISTTKTSINSTINVSTFGGATARDIFLWGAQLVEGTSALDYFPTTNRQDVPRIDFRNADGTLSSCGRLLLEPQRTNSIRNSTMVGAVAGSPGTLPTNWAGGGFANLTQTIVGLGTENGLQYIDLRFNGTAVGTIVRIFSESTTQITASNGQTWSSSVYIKRISGTFDSCAIGHALRGIGGSGLGVQTATVSVTTSLARYATTQTVNNASTLSVQPLVDFNVTSGATYDFTIRIAAPQMELGAYATTWVPTTTAAVTRIADTASKTGVSSLIGQTEGTLFVDITLTSRSSFSYFAIAPNLGATNTYIGIGISASSISFEVVNSGIQVAYSFPNTSTGSFKLAFAYKANDFVAYVNGALVHTDTSGTVPTCSQIGLNAYNNAASWNYNQAALFPTRLTNAQLAELTTL
jgi:hypothetical protein